MDVASTQSSSGTPAAFLMRIAVLGTCYVLVAYFAIGYFQKESFLKIFEAAPPLGVQLGIGAAAGILAAVLPIGLMAVWRRWRAMQLSAAAKNPGMFGSIPVIILISLIVGVTEEILFRAAIQPLIGLWPAAVLFTVVHLNFGDPGSEKRDVPMAVLSVTIVFGVSLLMGILFEIVGLAAAISAHILYDMTVLLSLNRMASRAVE